MNGLYKPADVSFPGFANTGDYNDPHLFFAYDGLNKVKSTDRRPTSRPTPTIAVEAGVLDALKFGVRLTSHQRSVLDYYNDGCFAQIRRRHLHAVQRHRAVERARSRTATARACTAAPASCRTSGS